jgi:hypothetical protein
MIGVTKFGDWGKAKAITGSMVEKFGTASKRAVLREAHFMRGELVKYLREGTFEPLDPKTLAVRALTGFKGTKPRVRTGDTRNSIVVKEIGDGAFVGILRTAKSKQGKALANIAEIMEFGATIVVPITLKSRRFYHAALAKAGLLGGGGSHRTKGGPVIAIVKIKPRPIFAPVWAKHGQPDAVRGRFMANLAGVFE